MLIEWRTAEEADVTRKRLASAARACQLWAQRRPEETRRRRGVGETDSRRRRRDLCRESDTRGTRSVPAASSSAHVAIGGIGGPARGHERARFDRQTTASARAACPSRSRSRLTAVARAVHLRADCVE